METKSREEAIECVKDHVLLIHKQIYARGSDRCTFRITKENK